MRMMLVGAGAVGESMLKILKWRDPKGEWLSYVLVGDYDASRAQEVVDLLADERFSYAQINATDKEQMKDQMCIRDRNHMEDIEDYAETLGFEDKSYLDLFCAVMKLDKKYRVPLLLFYYEGYSTQEIADLLGLPGKTVSTRLSRAKTKLKAYLKEE